jgi:hypothetical protein
MFGVSLPNTEHQLVFLQHQYQQLHQENMFYQTCIKNQQQLEELKAKKNPRTPPAEKKNRRTPQATINTCCIISLSLILLEYFNSELSSDADAGALG